MARKNRHPIYSLFSAEGDLKDAELHRQKALSDLEKAERELIEAQKKLDSAKEMTSSFKVIEGGITDVIQHIQEANRPVVFSTESNYQDGDKGTLHLVRPRNANFAFLFHGGCGSVILNLGNNVLSRPFGLACFEGQLALGRYVRGDWTPELDRARFNQKKLAELTSKAGVQFVFGGTCQPYGPAVGFSPIPIAPLEGESLKMFFIRINNVHELGDENEVISTVSSIIALDAY